MFSLCELSLINSSFVTQRAWDNVKLHPHHMQNLHVDQTLSPVIQLFIFSLTQCEGYPQGLKHNNTACSTSKYSRMNI